MRPRQGPIQQLIAYSDELRDKGDAERADEVLVEAAFAEPLAAPELLATLRSTQRATRADRVVARLSHVPIQLRAGVVRALIDARAEPDRTTLLESICAQSDEDVIGALVLFATPGTEEARWREDAWRPQDERPGASAADALCARLLEGPALRYEGLLARLYDFGLAGPAEHAAERFAAARPLRAIELAVEFDRAGLRQGAESLVANAVLRTPPHTLVSILDALEPSARRSLDPLVQSALTQHPDPHLLIDEFRQGGATGLADRFLHTVADRAPALAVAALYDGLVSLYAHDDADVVVARAAVRVDAPELCRALHSASRHRLAYLLAEQRT